MKLSVDEFLEIRARRSQDDMKVLIAFVEDKLGIKPEPPAGPAAATDKVTPDNPAEPQTVVTVADPVPVPHGPHLDNPPTDTPEHDAKLAKQEAADRKKRARTTDPTTKKSRSKRSSSKSKTAPARQDLATGTFKDTAPTTGLQPRSRRTGP